MNSILIALKEGVTLYSAGTIFRIQDTVVAKEINGVITKYYQIPDDAMGRPSLVEVKDVIACTDDMLKKSIPGHGRCHYTKSEVSGNGSGDFIDNFSIRNISIEDQYGAWLLKWKVPKKNTASPTASFTDKVTSETIVLKALQLTLDYKVFSIDPKTYEQTHQKRKGLHYLWDLSGLNPGFYKAEIPIDNTSTGIVHIVKHFPKKLDVEDKRKTNDIHELIFSGELWNAALDIMLAWGPSMRIPFQTRLLDKYPQLTWPQANYLEKICQEASSFAWREYEKEAAELISISDAMNEISTQFPWIDSERQARLRSQGQYYARK